MTNPKGTPSRLSPEAAKNLVTLTGPRVCGSPGQSLRPSPSTRSVHPARASFAGSKVRDAPQPSVVSDYREASSSLQHGTAGAQQPPLGEHSVVMVDDREDLEFPALHVLLKSAHVRRQRVATFETR